MHRHISCAEKQQIVVMSANMTPIFFFFFFFFFDSINVRLGVQNPM
jgi:hypothetical protein